MTWQDCAACAKHGQLCFCPDCQKYHTAFFCQYWPSSLLSCLYSFSPLHFPFFPFYPWGFPGVSKSFFFLSLAHPLDSNPPACQSTHRGTSCSYFVMTESLVRQKWVPLLWWKVSVQVLTLLPTRQLDLASHGPARLQVVHMLPNHSGSTNQSPFMNHRQQRAWFRCDDCFVWKWRLLRRLA